MNYLHVANKAYKSSLEFDQAILRQSGNCLYSLVEGLRQKNFGIQTLDKVLHNIRDYKSQCVAPASGNLFTDSGGYSIITGDVHPIDIPLAIECYGVYLEEERETYEFIFSLDIPMSLRFTQFNTMDRIYGYNRQSLQAAETIMEAHPKIRNKYYFVWQFKMLEQYAIWQRLFKELSLGKVTKNYAIGGMVGLRDVARINHSPFIPMAYKCLHEWETGGLGGEFRLHFLGMYIRYDRFQIALLEQLFRSYLGAGQSVAMSYDSINFVHTERLNKKVNYFVWRGGCLEVHQKAADVPQDVWATIYDTPVLQKMFEKGVEAREADKKLKSTNTFAPLNIYSNKRLDAFFEHIVVQSGLVNVILQERSPGGFFKHSDNILANLGKTYKEVFTPRMIKSIAKNLVVTFYMHYWRKYDGRPAELERLVTQEIQKLNFPYHLS